MRRLRHSPRFDLDKLRLQLVGQPRDDFVLHLEEIGHRLFEPLGPKVTAALRVDELSIDAHPRAAPLDASFERVAHVELPPDPCDVDGLAFVGEGGVAGDDERAADP